MKVLVTGASGFIGQHLLKSLLQDPQVTSIYALVQSESPFLDSRVQQVLGSLEQIFQHAALLREMDVVYHLAANAEFIDKNFDYNKINYKPTCEIVDLLTKSSVLKRFIFISSIGAFDRSASDMCYQPITHSNSPSPRSTYGSSKLKAEEYIQKSPLPWTIIRPAWVWGKKMRTTSHLKVLARLVAKNSLISRFFFPGKVSLIHVEDLAQSLAKIPHLATTNQRCYFASTEALALGTIFQIFRHQFKRSTSLFLFPFPSFLVRKFHQWLPPQISNLFIDYLSCDSSEFTRVFDLVQPKFFAHYVQDILAKTFFITGANSGIGWALAKQLSPHHHLILLDRETEQLKGLENSTVIACDLASEDQLLKTLQTLQSVPIDVLINNAGVGYKGTLPQLTSPQIKNTFAVNILAPTTIVHSLSTSLIKSKATIVNVASSVAFNPLPGMSLYAASKAFILNWSLALSYELKATNTVITVCPSGTKTNFQSAAAVKVQNEGRGLLEPSIVAQKIINAISEGKSQCLFIGKLTPRILNFTTHFMPLKWRTHVWGLLFEKAR